MRTPIDAVVTKTKGMAEGAAARRAGLVGVFHTLSVQHGEAGALFDRVKKHPGKREALWPHLRVALLTHEKSELLELYPVVRQHGGEALADQHAAEAKQLEAMIHKLESMDLANETEWMALFEQLGASVVQHAHEEEHDVFPEAQRLIGEQLAKELDKKLSATQRAVEKTVE